MNLLEKHILEKIYLGDWKPDFKIPPEKELIKEFNLSKSTIRKVIQGLVNREILYSIQGRGVFVSPFRNINNESSLEIELESSKAMYLPTSYIIPKKVYEFSPFEIPNIDKEKLFQFIKIYFKGNEVQAYAIKWVLNSDGKIKKHERLNYINGEKMILSKLDSKKVYHHHFFGKPIPFDQKLLRINVDYLPTTYSYYYDDRNNLKMIKLCKIKPKYFTKKQIRRINW